MGKTRMLPYLIALSVLLGIALVFIYTKRANEQRSENRVFAELNEIFLSRETHFNDKMRMIDSISKVHDVNGGIKARSLVYKAKISEYANDIDKSIKFLIETSHYMSELDKKDSILFYETLHRNLVKLSLIGDPVTHAKAALKEWNSQKSKDLTIKYYILDELASVYNANHNYDSARYYYSQAHALTAKLDNNLTKLHSYNNLGYFYFKQKKYALADSIFELGITHYGALPKPDLLEGEIYFHLRYNQVKLKIQEQNWMEADQLIQQLPERALFQDNELVYSSEYLRFLMAIEKDNSTDISKGYSAVSTLVKSAEDSLELLHHLVQIHFPEAINGNRNWSELAEKSTPKENAASKVELNQLIESVIKSNAQLNQEKIERKSLQRNSILIILFLVLIIVGIFIQRRFTIQKLKLNQVEDDLVIQSLNMKKNALDLELSQQKRNELENHLKYQKKDLENLAAEITTRQDYLSRMEERLNQLENKSNKSIIREMKLSLRHFLGLTKKHELIQPNDRVNSEFQAKLIRLNSEFSETELIICCYFRIGLEAKEIATIRNVSYHTIKAQRQEIRKKLGLERTAKLSTFLSQL
jgi:DNA-binding CsgD family transcriptional regulator